MPLNSTQLSGDRLPSGSTAVKNRRELSPRTMAIILAAIIALGAAAMVWMHYASRSATTTPAPTAAPTSTGNHSVVLNPIRDAMALNQPTFVRDYQKNAKCADMNPKDMESMEVAPAIPEGPKGDKYDVLCVYMTDGSIAASKYDTNTTLDGNSYAYVVEHYNSTDAAIKAMAGWPADNFVQSGPNVLILANKTDKPSLGLINEIGRRTGA